MRVEIKLEMFIENILSALLPDSYLGSNLKQKGVCTLMYYEAASVKELVSNMLNLVQYKG